MSGSARKVVLTMVCTYTDGPEYYTFQNVDSNGSQVSAYRRSLTKETSNLFAMAFPSFPPRNLIWIVPFEDDGQHHNDQT